jgi:HD-like signal output (HDOD) protein
MSRAALSASSSELICILDEINSDPLLSAKLLPVFASAVILGSESTELMT